jgi:hypothetical protein
VEGNGVELEEVWKWAGEVAAEGMKDKEELLAKLCAGEVEKDVSRSGYSQLLILSSVLL